MKMRVDDNGMIQLTEVYIPIVIKTERGYYGIAQRGWGIEIWKDGKMIFRDADKPCDSCKDRDNPEKCRCHKCSDFNEQYQPERRGE